MIVGLVIALLLAFLAFRFLKGLIKFALIAVIVIVAIYFFGVRQ